MMTRSKVCLHVGWRDLSRTQRKLVRVQYRVDRKRGHSVADARYYANYLIDVLQEF